VRYDVARHCSGDRICRGRGRDPVCSYDGDAMTCPAGITTREYLAMPAGLQMPLPMPGLDTISVWSQVPYKFKEVTK